MKNNLKKFRTEAGLSLQKLGDACGITKVHIWELQKDKYNPTLKTAYGIANVLDKTVYDIWPDKTKVEEVTTTVRRVKK